jgi:hypothetical protein
VNDGRRLGVVFTLIKHVMNLIKSFLVLSVCSGASVSYSQTGNEADCNLLKHCKLQYVTKSGTTDHVIINDDKHTEYLEDGKYYIKSDLTWVNACEFTATMTELTVPDFYFKPGDVLNVKFDKIENGLVYGISTIRGKKYNVLFKLME